MGHTDITMQVYVLGMEDIIVDTYYGKWTYRL